MEKDVLGGKPLVLSLAKMLALAETKISGLEREIKSGQEYTLPSVSDEGEVTEPQPLSELLGQWKEEKTRLEKVIAWAEAREPGSSRRGDGVKLIEEYEERKD